MSHQEVCHYPDGTNCQNRRKIFARGPGRSVTNQVLLFYYFFDGIVQVNAAKVLPDDDAIGVK